MLVPRFYHKKQNILAVFISVIVYMPTSCKILFTNTQVPGSVHDNSLQINIFSESNRTRAKLLFTFKLHKREDKVFICSILIKETLNQKGIKLQSNLRLWNQRKIQVFPLLQLLNMLSIKLSHLDCIDSITPAVNTQNMQNSASIQIFLN